MLVLFLFLSAPSLLAPIPQINLEKALQKRSDIPIRPLNKSGQNPGKTMQAERKLNYKKKI